MRTGAAYIRVSTDMQTELSPDSQLKLIQQYAKQNDIILNKCNIFSDDGISGRHAEKRPEFMRMIATAKQKPRPFDVILVWKFSRFARNREDSILYKSMLRKDCGIEVISVSEPVGEDKTSILIEALLEAMDEYYSLNLAEEVRRGMTEKVSRGGIVVAPPFGYMIKDGKYVPEPSQAKAVQMVFSRYLEGAGTRTIAAEINELGYKTRRGGKFENRTIEYMLTNPTYIGKLRFNPTGKATVAHKYNQTEDTIIVDGGHEPIIDKETFEAAGKLLEQTKKKYPKNYNQRQHEYFFRGLVRCSNCGATLCQAVKGQSLQCHNYAKGSCKISHSISIEKLKTAVIEALERDAETNSKLNFIEIPRAKSNADANDMIRDQIEKEQLKLERIKAAYEDGIDTLEEYKNNKQKILSTIKALEDRIKPIENIKNNELNFRKKISEIVQSISNPEITPLEFNSEIREIVSKIIFNRTKGNVEIFYKQLL